VLARLRRPLHESEAAAATRFGDLVTDLVTWAKAQYTTAPAGQPPRAPRQEAALPPHAAGSGSAPHHRRSVTPRGRRPAAAHAAAAAAPVAGPANPLAAGSSSDEEDNAFPAHAAAAGAATSPRTSTRVYWYTGNKEEDAVETARRLANGLCLQCHPSGPINAWPCPVHANRGQRSGTNVPRCITYPS
jgi:hypothetical protein